MNQINKKQHLSLALKADLNAWKRTITADLIRKYRTDTVSGNDLWNLLGDKKDLKLALLREQGFLCCYCGCPIDIHSLNGENSSLNNAQIEHLIPKGQRNLAGKYISKHLTYDYDNLLVSCQGGTKDVIHCVSDNKETVQGLAKRYGVTVEQIVELKIQKTNLKTVKIEYDLEKLQIGDRVLIIMKTPAENQHCGHKKGDTIIPIHPLMQNCHTNFKYNFLNGYIVENCVNNLDAKNTIAVLGLNNNAYICYNRNDIMTKAQNILSGLISITAGDIPLLRQKVGQLIQAYLSPDNQGCLKPFYFVEIAVFQQRVVNF